MLIFPSSSLVYSTCHRSSIYSGCYEWRPTTMLNKPGLYTVASLYSLLPVHRHTATC